VLDWQQVLHPSGQANTLIKAGSVNVHIYDATAFGAAFETGDCAPRSRCPASPRDGRGSSTPTTTSTCSGRGPTRSAGGCTARWTTSWAAAACATWTGCTACSGRTVPSTRMAYEEHVRVQPNDAQQRVFLGLALAFLG
jgi:hypothetical protein